MRAVLFKTIDMLIDKIILVGECIFGGRAHLWMTCFSSSTQLQFYFNYKTASRFVREQNSTIFLWDSCIYRAIWLVREFLKGSFSRCKELPQIQFDVLQ